MRLPTLKTLASTAAVCAALAFAVVGAALVPCDTAAGSFVDTSTSYVPFRADVKLVDVPEAPPPLCGYLTDTHCS